MRFTRMANRGSPFALAFAAVVAAHLCCGVDRAFPQVPAPGPDAPPQEPPPGGYQAGTPDIYASLGLNLAVAFPFGEFSNSVSAGFGLTGDISFRLVPAGWLGLRIDGGVIWYGYETSHELVYVDGVPLEVEKTIENYVAGGAIGPQLHLAGHPMSARVYGLAGMSYFETSSSVRFDNGNSSVPNVRLGSYGYLSDWTPSLTIGGEVRWVLGGNRDGFLGGLGLNVEWRRHGTTRYLVEGSITEVNGRPTFEPLESRVDFFLISIGLWGGTW